MSGDDQDYETLQGTLIIERVIKIEQIVSEAEVKELKPKSRKCLFSSEPQSKYFDVIIYGGTITLKSGETLTREFFFRFTRLTYARWIVESIRR